jgi:hypothetical protein
VRRNDRAPGEERLSGTALRLAELLGAHMTREDEMLFRFAPPGSSP